MINCLISLVWTMHWMTIDVVIMFSFLNTVHSQQFKPNNSHRFVTAFLFFPQPYVHLFSSADQFLISDSIYSILLFIVGKIFVCKLWKKSQKKKNKEKTVFFSLFQLNISPDTLKTVFFFSVYLFSSLSLLHLTTTNKIRP